MGNHFHLLLETPEPNLVGGMKWLPGASSQGWNRRKERRGHVFQGRYKAVVVNGEERDGSYFKIVADYIHLNPARSGAVLPDRKKGGVGGGAAKAHDESEAERIVAAALVVPGLPGRGKWKRERELVAALVRK